MKILVCGGRDYKDYDLVCLELDRLERAKGITAVVHGDCRGADHLGRDWGHLRGKVVIDEPAEWGRLGRSAGPIRNARMLESHPDIVLVVAFFGGRGTEDMIAKAAAKNIPIYRVGK